MIKKVFLTAIFSGLIGGIVLGSVQQMTTVPIILQAETYEGGNLISYDNKPIQQLKQNSEDENMWSPSDGFERTLFTFIADIFVSTGFSFILVGLYLFLKKVDIKNGLISGVIGYLSFFVIPSLGLSPEIPGVIAASLDIRQAWWIGTVFLSIIAFAILFFNSNIKYKVLALGLFVVPFIIGVPLPSFEAGTAPKELLDMFSNSAYLVNAIFWITLGLVSSFIYIKQFELNIIDKRI